MGFRAEVDDFQPIYIFKPTPKKMTSLRLGIEILEEAMAIATEKEGRAKAAAVGSKGEVERRKELVHSSHVVFHLLVELI
jgi:hypothetical protein